MIQTLTNEQVTDIKVKAKAATQGEWAPGCFCDESSSCECKYIFSEGYNGSIATISIDNDLRIGEGGNDSPPIEEAKANLSFIAAANPSAVLSLIATLQSAQAENAKLRQTLKMLWMQYILFVDVENDEIASKCKNYVEAALIKETP